MLLAVGFFVSESTNTNYEFLNSHASKMMWSMLFAAHGILLLYLALFEMPQIVKRFVSAVGLFLWTYVFLSFTFYDPTPINSTEWMLVLPMLIEMWFMAEAEHK